MEPFDLSQFDAEPTWRALLAAYYARQQQTEQPWSPRLASVDGIPAEQLSAVHGKLMAYEFLKVDIANRTEGLVYQVTPWGREALLPPEKRQTAPEWQLATDSVAA